MDIKQIKELMSAMEGSGITKISMKEKTGFELQIERELPTRHGEGEPSVIHAAMLAQGPRHHEFPHVHHVPHHMPVSQESKSAPEPEGRYITSPMVGTFYASPSPDHASFVKAGDVVNEGSVVCIIEAMKVMNEIKATMSGTIAEICVENGHPVEFGTKLFRIV